MHITYPSSRIPLLHYNLAHMPDTLDLAHFVQRMGNDFQPLWVNLLVLTVDQMDVEKVVVSVVSSHAYDVLLDGYPRFKQDRFLVEDLDVMQSSSPIREAKQFGLRVSCHQVLRQEDFFMSYTLTNLWRTSVIHASGIANGANGLVLPWTLQNAGPGAVTTVNTFKCHHHFLGSAEAGARENRAGSWPLPSSAVYGTGLYLWSTRAARAELTTFFVDPWKSHRTLWAQCDTLRHPTYRYSSLETKRSINTASYVCRYPNYPIPLSAPLCQRNNVNLTGCARHREKHARE